MPSPAKGDVLTTTDNMMEFDLNEIEEALDKKCRELFPDNYKLVDNKKDKKEETAIQRQQRILREKYGDKTKTPAPEGGE